MCTIHNKLTLQDSLALKILINLSSDFSFLLKKYSGPQIRLLPMIVSDIVKLRKKRTQ